MLKRYGKSIPEKPDTPEEDEDLCEEPTNQVEDKELDASSPADSPVDLQNVQLKVDEELAEGTVPPVTKEFNKSLHLF